MELLRPLPQGSGITFAAAVTMETGSPARAGRRLISNLGTMTAAALCSFRWRGGLNGGPDKGH